MQYERLFQRSVSNFVDQKIKDAVSKVEFLSDDELLDHGIEARLEEIVEQFRFVTATLKPEDRKGKRRTEMKEVHDYDVYRQVEVTFIDVTIPFDGYPISFSLAPSHCNIIGNLAKTTNEGLVVSFADDDNIDSNVDSFISMVSENLDRLRKEIENVPERIRDSVTTVANQRIEKLRAQKERDKSRSFPIE